MRTFGESVSGLNLVWFESTDRKKASIRSNERNIRVICLKFDFVALNNEIEI